MTLETFLEKLEQTPRWRAKIHAHSSGCWLWTGEISTKGYGLIQVSHSPRRRRVAHRALYEIAIGLIPVELELDHLCKVKLCVNPNHLEVVTGKENNARSSSPTAINAQKTHCYKGHELKGRNLLPHGVKRKCRICYNARVKKWRAGKRAGSAL